jgi:hypothetical protein
VRCSEDARCDEFRCALTAIMGNQDDDDKDVSGDLPSVVSTREPCGNTRQVGVSPCSKDAACDEFQ